MNLDIIVVANYHRKALVEEHLKNVSYKMSYTPDYELPTNFKPQSEYVGLVCNQIGAYRCFKGNQDAIRMSTKENVLIFEDDAVPNTSDWYNIVQDSIPLLNDFEIVSLHGREFDKSQFNEYKTIRPNNNYLVLKEKKGIVFICGSLSYLINKRTFEKILNYTYDGMPMDLFLYNRFNFCLLETSPFNHDRSQGSLVE